MFQQVLKDNRFSIFLSNTMNEVSGNCNFPSSSVDNLYNSTDVHPVHRYKKVCKFINRYNTRINVIINESL